MIGRTVLALGAALALVSGAGGPGHGDSAGLVKFLGRFHPVAVHFPVALVLSAALAEALFLFTRKALFTDGARLMLILGAAGAAVAVPLGLAARVEFGSSALVTWHLIFGLSAAGSSLLAAGAREIAERKSGGGGGRWAYRALLFLSAALAGVTGHLGGLLTHGRDAFNWPS